MNHLPQNAQQIARLGAEGYTAEQIYTMLDGDYEIEIIQTILLATQPQANGISVVAGDNETPDNTIALEADAIYKQAQAQVAKRLVRIALTETENVTAAVKAQIYINEEATGRNKERVTNAGRGGVVALLAEGLERIRKAKEAAGLHNVPKQQVIEV